MSDSLADIVAYTVFVQEKRRYAVPINAKGEAVGPPLPFRNVNRKRRNGYGPGSSDTDIDEETASSPLQPPADATSFVAAAAVARPADGVNVSSNSDSTHSLPCRSGRQRLSRSVSFVSKPEPGDATAAASTNDSVVEKSRARRLSILQKKSSFRTTLPPLFDFAYEPPHTPVTRKQRGVATGKSEQRSNEGVGVTAPYPPQERESAPNKPSEACVPPVLKLESVGWPLAPLTPSQSQGKAVPGVRFAHSSSVAAAEVLARSPGPLAKKTASQNSVSPSPSTLMYAGIAPVVIAPPTQTSPQCAVSPAKDCVTLVRSTLLSPPPDDFFELWRFNALTTSPQAAAKGTATKAEPLALAPTTPTRQQQQQSSSPEATKAKPTVALQALKRTHDGASPCNEGSHHGGHLTEGEDISNSGSRPVNAPAEKLQGTKHEAALKPPRAKRDTTSEKQGKPGRCATVGHGEMVEKPTSLQRLFYTDSESLPPKLSDLMSPPTTKKVASSEPKKSRVSTPPSSASYQHSSFSSPSQDFSTELDNLRVISALGVYGEDDVHAREGRTTSSASPTAQFDEDTYEMYRCISPQLIAPTHVVATTTAAAEPSVPSALSQVPVVVVTVSPSSKTKGCEGKMKSTAASVPSPELTMDMDMYSYLTRAVATPSPPLPQSAPQPRSPHRAHARTQVHGTDFVSHSSLRDLRAPCKALTTLKKGETKYVSRVPPPRFALPPLSAQWKPHPYIRRRTLPYASLSHTPSSPLKRITLSAFVRSDPLPASHCGASRSLSQDSSPGDASSSSAGSPSAMEFDDDDESFLTISGTLSDEEYDEAGDESTDYAESGNSSIDSPTTRDSRSTASTASSDLLSNHRESFWSSMMRRLRQPLMAKPSTGVGESVTHQVKHNRHWRALAKSRVFYGSRVEKVRSSGRGLSSIETEAKTDPLWRRRRAKSGPLN
jgi:hypothetical protein